VSGEPLARTGDDDTPLHLRLAMFEGPLEMLLHLVRTGGIDVATLPLVEVARQCDEYLALLRMISLEAAGDHLVMTATLVHMKSRSLLPPDPAGMESPQEDPGLESGHGDRHLLVVRKAAEQLQEREAVMELLYSRPPDRVREFAGEQGIDADLYALLNAFQAILRRLGSDPAARVTRERITLVDRISWLMDLLTRERRVGFRALFEEMADRLSCILTFLALLEVIRLRLVRAYVSHHQEDILIMLMEDQAPPPAPVSGERADA
jgi:segregation and condensation protein A